MITCGVPQGSVLGPVLFLLCINDLANAVDKSKVRLFADDTGLYTYSRDFGSLLDSAKIEFRKLFKWCKLNKLTINYSKTCFLLFHAKNKAVPDNFDHIEVDGIKINRSVVTKYLGTFLDENLNWHAHIDHLCKSLIKYFGIFNKIRHFVTSKIARQLYFAFIYSRISYSIEVYGTCSKEQLSKVQILQNKLLKMLYSCRYRTPTEQLHLDIHILKVKDIYLCNTLAFVNSCLMGNVPDYFKTYFNLRDNNYNLRQNQLYVPRTRTVMGSVSTQVHGARLWNCMHPDCRKVAFQQNFKKLLMNHMIAQYCT